MKDTEEQIKIYQTIKEIDDVDDQVKVVISAAAGSGKTTTILRSLQYINTMNSVVFLAFNKAIANEINIRLQNMQSHAECSTIHSLAYGLLNQYINSIITTTYNSKVKLKINNNLFIFWLKQNGYKVKNLDECKMLIDLAREELIDYTETDLNNLIDKYQIRSLLDIEKMVVLDFLRQRYQVSEIKKLVTNKNGQMTFELDFTDMIYLPLKFNIPLTSFDFIFIDEAQDLSKLKYAFINMLEHETTKTIYIGDLYQSIYLFSGASPDLFEKLGDDAIKLSLSNTFRCSKKIIEEVKNVFPYINIKPFDTNPDGFFTYVTKDKLFEDKEDNIMVLSPINSALLGIFLDLLGAKRKAYIKGSNFDVILTKWINTMIPSTNKTDSVGVLLDFITQYINKYYLKLTKKGMTQKEIKTDLQYIDLIDKKRAVETVANFFKIHSVNELKQKIITLFDQEETGVMLSTTHKSKGLEANNVYILKPRFYQMEQKKDWVAQQIRNLQYVAYTRAKNNLYIIND